MGIRLLYKMMNVNRLYPKLSELVSGGKNQDIHTALVMPSFILGFLKDVHNKSLLGNLSIQVLKVFEHVLCVRSCDYKYYSDSLCQQRAGLWEEIAGVQQAETECL